MKLVHPDLEGHIFIDSKKASQWVIESPDTFVRYLQELNMQVTGTEGNFILVENDKEYDISKYVEIIINPFAVNINDKKILNKLYAELSELAYGEDNYLSTQEILGKLQEYFYKVEQTSLYMLECDEKMDTSGIWKILGVKFGDYSNDFMEVIGQYIKIIVELMKKKLVVFVNLGSYLNVERMEQLIELANYNEIAVLLIENIERNFSKEVFRYIIDSDNCEIY